LKLWQKLSDDHTQARSFPNCPKGNITFRMVAKTLCERSLTAGCQSKMGDIFFADVVGSKPLDDGYED
jgi:hypothetical protein